MLRARHDGVVNVQLVGFFKQGQVLLAACQFSRATTLADVAHVALHQLNRNGGNAPPQGNPV